MSSYKPIFPFTGAKVSTIYPFLFRPKGKDLYSRKRITMPDEDFLDLDLVQNNHKELVILCHGLEGDTGSKYLRRLAGHLVENKFDIVAINFRSCSGEMNLAKRLYHSGETGDVNHIISLYEDDYDTIHLVGFSLGGNVVLKLAGENPHGISKKIKSVQGISVPVDLASAAAEIVKPHNHIFEKRFIADLSHKAMLKNQQYPGLFDMEKVAAVKNLMELDDLCTAPLHGFIDGQDYYAKSSAKQFIKDLEIPAQLINAQNDSFLGEQCYPYEDARENPLFTLLDPKHGGHVGFVRPGRKWYWHELKIIDFLQSHR